MKYKLFFILAILGLLIGCQGQALSHPELKAAEPPDDLLFAEDALIVQGQPGEAAAVYNQRSGTLAWELPAGRLAADGLTYVAAETAGAKSTIAIYQPQQAEPKSEYTLDAAVDLAVVSADGRWAVLTHDQPLKKEKLQTTVQLLDLSSGELSEAITLDGDFFVEGVDNLGRSVYLIEYLEEVADGHHYRVRLFNGWTNRLDPNPIRDKRFLDEIMAGYAWGTATDPNGRWLTTLYVNNLRDEAFIHALNQDDRWALCLALPSDVDHLAQLKYYALAIAPAGDAVLAVNPLLGQLVDIDLNDTANQITTSFDPVERDVTGVTLDHQTPEQILSTALSPDGRTLYFAFDRTVWRYDRQTQTVSPPQTLDKPLLSLAVTPQSGDLLLVFHDQSVEKTAADALFAPAAAQVSP